MDGVIIVDKPEGFTSHDVVNRMRRLANTRKVGHLGTLDPMATGVLPLVIGRATRLAQFMVSVEKEYDGTIRFGFSTDTYDREGAPQSDPVSPSFTRGELDAALNAFRGTFLQTPPPFSAKKIAGTPAHRLARRNIALELAPVEVCIYSLEVLEWDGEALLKVRVRCGSGTYLRSVAHDLGQSLGCGAHLVSLRRTASGDFTIGNAHTLDQLKEMADAGKLADALIPAVGLLPQFPNAVVDTLTAGQIRQGKDFRTSPFALRQGSKYVKAIGPEGDLVAIGEARLPHLYHPILVL